MKGFHKGALELKVKKLIENMKQGSYNKRKCLISFECILGFILFFNSLYNKIG